MIFRVFVIAYGVGALLGFLGVIEWLLDRAASRVWLSHLVASFVSCVAGFAFWLADRRRTPR
jgi:Na+/H+ antiporter NhaC